MKMELCKEFENLQQKLIINREYVEGNIQKFIKELKGLKLITSSSDVKDKRILKFCGKQKARLELISRVICTKKFVNGNIKDSVQLGEYLKELGEEFINFGKNNEEEIETLEDEKDSKKDKEKEAKDLFEKLIDAWLDEE